MAKIDVTSIEGYENMTADQKVEALLNLDYDDGSSEIDRLKDMISQKNSEVAQWKKKHNALLSDEDRKRTENDEAMQALKDELETLRKEKAVSGFTAKLLENGFSPDGASKGADALVNGDFDAFFGQLSTYKADLEKSIKADLIRQNPAPGGSGGTNAAVTKESLGKMSMAERMKFAAEHPDEYMEAYKN